MPPATTYAAECQAWITEAVNRRRGTVGFRRALAEVSRLTRFRERRVVAYLRGEVKNPSAADYETIKNIARGDLEKWVLRHQAEVERLRSRLAEWDGAPDGCASARDGSAAPAAPCAPGT